MDLAKLDTEKRNPRTMQIDTLTTQEMLTLINQEDQTVPLVVQGCIEQITRLVDACFTRLQQGGRVIYVGAGTSGRLGVLDASECPPTYGVDFEMFRGVMAGGYEALLKAKEGAEDSVSLGKEDMQALNLTALDTVIGLAASGRTPYVAGALTYANEIGALTGSICCTHQAALSEISQFPIEAVTGPEAVTGSTRMKAGTAQKLILNMISTTLMIKYGKVYQNLMVDVQPTNQKLVERSLRIIQEATGCSPDQAKQTFEASGHEVKLAICMYLSQNDKAACEAMLKEVNGNISQAIRQLLHRA